MNIKRMAEKYREQVSGTGEHAKRELEDLVKDSFSDWRVDSACRYLRQWYLHLKKALGKEKSLRELQRSWEKLNEMKEVLRRNKKKEIICDKEKELLRVLAGVASERLNRFLKNLPCVIEESLRHSVRESGIRL